MSILLSLYTKDGIVFAADRNITLSTETEKAVLEDYMTKVLLWPNRKAVIGFVGNAQIEELDMDEWLRIFIAETRNFESLSVVAKLLIERVQLAYEDAGLTSSDVPPPLIIHLGGFEKVEGVDTPMMYLITNVVGLNDRGGYTETRPDFKLSERTRHNFEGPWIEGRPMDYPREVRAGLEDLEGRRSVLWFNNGMRYDMFNIFKGALMGALMEVFKRVGEQDGNRPMTLFDWEVYAKMAIQLYGSYFRESRPPSERVVGGGVNCGSVPWPR